MAYYRPDDRVGGYPLGAELGEDGPSEIGAIDRGFRQGGDYVQQGYGVPSYGYERGAPSYGYERGRPLGGGYVGGAPEYYGAERSGGYGYGREGYAPSVYDQGYPPRQQQILVQPPVEYIQAEPSDLGMGLRDAGKVARHHGTDYGAGYGRPELSGYGGTPGYGAAGYGPAGHEDDEVRRLRKELEHERRSKHELELATAGALGYGLYERHEKNDAEELGRSEPKKEKKRHHFFSRD